MFSPENITIIGNQIIFLALAFITVVSAIMVITRKEIVHSAMFLVLAFFGVAGLYVQLKAQFVAAVQILVYAGGIMVLYLFVILLVNQRAIEKSKHSIEFKMVATIVGIFLFLEFILIFIEAAYRSGVSEKAAETSIIGNTEQIGTVLYTKFLFPFELVSIVLLAAMIGAIVLSKRKI